ncbi:MAG: YdiU family protein [Undibacterium sp.]|nr:YdiU family protein [Undibacterium sp.]
MPSSSIDLAQTLAFQNNFARLGTRFYSAVQASTINAPYLIAHSDSMANDLGFTVEQVRSPSFCDIFSGKQKAVNSETLAAVYSGHQFGVWAGQLGDGRALLLGDLPLSDQSGRLEIQLKGAGITPYSRMGDGRAVLRSSVREFLCSEAMAALGIATSRALCITGSDQYVMREQPEKMAIVTRTAKSFIRFGSFEHWYYQGQSQELQMLADFVINNYYPHLQNNEHPYQALLRTVVESTADLMACWQAVGFMHGVMNTDNMSILGLTLDYGPFGFMDGFDPEHVCNHSDDQGRYAFHMQPRIGQWNCHALAQALLPLIGSVEATQEALSCYVPRFEQSYQHKLRSKFGLITVQDGDTHLFDDFFSIMALGQTDFTLAFRYLSQLEHRDPCKDEVLRDLFINRAQLDAWLVHYRTRLAQENSVDTQRHAQMKQVNPKYILRNYLAQQAIAAAEQKDFSEIAKLLKVLEHPFDEQEENERYAALPPEWASRLSVSCSS